MGRQLFERMGRWRLNAYMYAPKDDIKHRALWRSLYDAHESQAERLQQLIGSARAHGISFVYAIAPGLDISYAKESDWMALKARLAQLIQLGCTNFAFLFDDIDDTAALQGDAAVAFSSFAEAQCHVTNLAVEYVLNALSGQKSDSAFLFCPTPYCGQRALPSPACEHIVDRTEYHFQGDIELRAVIKRKPVIWDNLHANDYDMRRVYLGPYCGRSPALLEEIAGILSNPNCQYEANFVALRTLAIYSCSKSGDYDPDVALTVAINEWRPSFSPSKSQMQATEHGYTYYLPPPEEVALLCDLFYLPYQHGQRAVAYRLDLKWLLDNTPAQGEWQRRFDKFKEDSNRIIHLYSHMTEIENRDLLYALYGHLWGLKEEAYLLVRFLEHAFEQQSQPQELRRPFFSAEHQPQTYRGGILADLQELLPMSVDGSFSVQSTNAPETYIIRPYTTKDQSGVYQVCLQTGDAGKDGTHRFPDDPHALGHRYVGPYITLQKDLAIVLEDSQGICGYALAALDSGSFYHRFRTEWLPYVHSQYSDLEKPVGDPSLWTPTQTVYNEFFKPSLYFPEEWGKQYPSHLHIDLVARAQRKGLGSKMITQLLDLLRERGSIGVHLEMSAKNDGAYAFYLKLGFEELARREGCIFLGLKLAKD